jgi:Sec-independent protein translocase protein TatA
MNIVGMGPLEILVVLLLAFIVLGPQKMMEGAKMLGKASREIRRMADELPTIVLDEDLGRPSRASSPAKPATESSQPPSETQSNGESAIEDDAPVAFQRTSSKPESDKADEK